MAPPITDRIVELERSLKSARNYKHGDETAKEAITEQGTLKSERDELEKNMLEAVDAGEGYFKPLQWQAPIACQRARQKLDVLSLLITHEYGEKVLGEIGEYLYMGDVVDGIIRTSNETFQRRISREDIAKIKFFNIQDNLLRVREGLAEVLNNGTDEN